MSERNVATFAAGLKALAAWYEAHPDMPLPEGDVPQKVFGLHSKEDAAAVVTALGSCRKDYSPGLLYILRDFGGGVALAFVFARDAVCVRKVVGTEHVPAEIVPAYEREIVEWECEPLLTDGGAEA